jgi:predicted RNase H-like HicB family nuclease
MLCCADEPDRADRRPSGAISLHLPPEEEGGYTVRCDAFPELITNGRTLEEARAAAREALELCLEVYRDEGRPIPESDADPRTVIKEVVSAKLAPA